MFESPIYWHIQVPDVVDVLNKGDSFEISFSYTADDSITFIADLVSSNYKTRYRGFVYVFLVYLYAHTCVRVEHFKRNSAYRSGTGRRNYRSMILTRSRVQLLMLC